MPFVQHFIEPKYLSRTNLFEENGSPRVSGDELQAVTNNTLCNALRQLASLVLVADDIFTELGGQLQTINKRSEAVKVKINALEEKVTKFDPKEVTVPESDICSFALLKNHYAAKQEPDTGLFRPETRSAALRSLYDAATKTPVHLMRQLDRWRRDGHRTSRFFLCTPVLGAKRRKIRAKVDIDIETSMPAALEELRRWTSDEALGDITVTPNCVSRIAPSNVTTSTYMDGDTTDGTLLSDDEGVDHKLPSPEEQLQVVALRFPAEIVAVDVSGRSFDRMSTQRRSLIQGKADEKPADGDATAKRIRTRHRRPRSRRRNTLAGTGQKEIHDAITAGEQASSPILGHEAEPSVVGAVSRSKSSDILRVAGKKESPEGKKSHFNTLKQWGKSRYDRFMNKSSEAKQETTAKSKDEDIDDFSVYETVTSKRKRDFEKERKTHERNSSISSSEKSSITSPVANTLSSVMNIAVKLRDSSSQRRQRRNGGNKDEPHSSSGNWSASSESGRASIGSEITSTTHPKSTTSAATSSNSLNHQPGSVHSRRRFNANTSTSSSVTSEGTLTPDIIQDLHEDGETSSVYSCDTEGYYTSFHMDSGLKTLKEEDSPPTPLHSSTAFSNSSSDNTILSAENEYELFGKGSTSTTTSSAGTVCTTLRASESNKSLTVGPAVPERKSSLSKLSNKSAESSLERDFSDKTGTVKRSPGNAKPTVIALIHKKTQGDVSPDSGHNTSSSPIESISSPNGIRSGSDFEFSESSDVEGPERIERIRVKTTINSSRIPSMCVITPPHSDDESVNSSESSQKDYKKHIAERNGRNQLQPKQNEENILIQPTILTTSVNGTKKFSLVNINPVSGYATVESIDQPDSIISTKEKYSRSDINQNTTNIVSGSIRASSPSGGTVTVKEDPSISKSPPTRPVLKPSLLPINSVFGRLKINLTNFTQKRERSRSPSANKTDCDAPFDSGEYVTIADVRNNNEKAAKIIEDVTYANQAINANLNTVLSGEMKDAEYVSLNELPGSEHSNVSSDSLERRRQGARVTLDAEGKVVYSSDSLRRRQGAHTTFEPGPRVKSSPGPSPVPSHRTPKSVRPVANSQNQMLAAISPVEFTRPLSPQSEKYVIRASSATAEIVRKPPSTIVAPQARPTSPKSFNRGAYVHVQDAGRSLSPTHTKERVPSPATSHQASTNTIVGNSKLQLPKSADMYHPRDSIETNMDNRYLSSQYYFHGGSNMYSTMPSKKTQFLNDYKTNRSVTPDITKGLDKDYNICASNQKIPYNIQGHEQVNVNYQHSLPRNFYRTDQNIFNQKFGIPVQIPDISCRNVPSTVMNPKTSTNAGPHSIYKSDFTTKGIRPSDPSSESPKISPIDPRHSRGFQSSTPFSKSLELKAAVNLEAKLMSPKKSTMSNEELYAVIHKSKKRMNIEADQVPRPSPTIPEIEAPPKQALKSPETGYLGDKSRSRLSWSPNKGDYVDFNSDIDNLSPPKECRSRQSWACSDRKNQKSKQTSTIDFKRLLLQKSSNSTPKKLSAVEQLKLSKQQIKLPQSKAQPDMNILDLSGSPRSLVNRKFLNNASGSPSRDLKAAPKVLSPRSQWRFPSPRTDVLSSTILEDCREDESPNSSGEKKQPSPHSFNKYMCTENIPKSENVPHEIQNDLQSAPVMTITEKLRAQRAQFLNCVPNVQEIQPKIKEIACPPTLETSF